MKIPFLARSRKPIELPKLQKRPPDLVNSFFCPTFWWTKNPQKVTDLIRAASQEAAPGVHFADNLFTWGRNNSMLEDESFVKAWTENIETDADRAIVWRRYILACAAYHFLHLPGDFVECGGYTGVGVKTVIDYLGGPRFPKDFWLYDLFEHDASMLHQAMPEHGPDLYARVAAKFASYQQVRICKGNIPDIFQKQSPGSIAYLHIDLNEAPAEVATLDALFERVVPSGIVILDDYEWSGLYRTQKQAEDAWFDPRGYHVFPLPTGQGLVFKR